MAMPDYLACHVATLGETGPVDDVVEAALEDLQEGFTSLAPGPCGLGVVVAELLLQHAVDPASLLLLAHLEQVLALFGTVPAVLTRRVRPDLDRAFRRVTFGALEDELGLLPPAKLTVRTGVSSPACCLLLSSPAQTRRRLGGRQPLCGTA